ELSDVLRSPRPPQRALQATQRTAIELACLVEIPAREIHSAAILGRPRQEADMEAPQGIVVPPSGLGQVAARLPVIPGPEHDPTGLERLLVVRPRLDSAEVEELRDRARRRREPAGRRAGSAIELVAVQDVRLDAKHIAMRAAA